LRLCERLGCGHVFGLFTRGLRPAGPDGSSAWLFASITVSRSICVACQQVVLSLFSRSRCRDGMPHADEPLTPASRDDLADAIAFALCFRERKRV